MRIRKSDLDLYYIVANVFNAIIPEYIAIATSFIDNGKISDTISVESK